MSISPPVTELIARLYHEESRRVLATLIRLLGDFDLAEEALHEAFRSAVEQWPQSGVPDNPRAWLVSAGRFRAIDSLRRQRRFQPLDDQVELSDERGAEEGRNNQNQQAVADVHDPWDAARQLFKHVPP